MYGAFSCIHHNTHNEANEAASHSSVGLAVFLNTPTSSVLMTQISGHPCRWSCGHSSGLALGPRLQPPRQGWRPQAAAERLPTPPSSPPRPYSAELINRWNRTRDAEIPPASIETNSSNPEHHLGGLPGPTFDVPCCEVSAAGSRDSRGTRQRKRSTCAPPPPSCAPSLTDRTPPAPRRASAPSRP